MTNNDRTKDHRAMIAMSWTAGTFAYLMLLVYLVFAGVDIPDAAWGALTPLFTLCGIFLKSYFDIRERKERKE